MYTDNGDSGSWQEHNMNILYYVRTYVPMYIQHTEL